jgi:hypothetical protein
MYVLLLRNISPVSKEMRHCKVKIYLPQFYFSCPSSAWPTYYLFLIMCFFRILVVSQTLWKGQLYGFCSKSLACQATKIQHSTWANTSAAGAVGAGWQDNRAGNAKCAWAHMTRPYQDIYCSALGTPCASTRGWVCPLFMPVPCGKVAQVGTSWYSYQLKWVNN